MATSYTHAKDCSDRKDAAADRKSHMAVVAEREQRGQALARAEWLDWYAPSAPRVVRE
jgi:hypothetical protein